MPQAQKGKLSGKIFSSSNEVIAQATVKLFNKDSVIIRSASSDSLGNFFFINLSSGTYTLQAEALSYTTVKKPVQVQGTKSKHVADTIFMQPSFQDLQSVVVTAKRPNVVVKKDTTEFIAASFKTGKTATVEDIFRKMPGVEVSKNGSIKAQGESITQIYVDGKPFFGTDLKAVTQNFPADIIDRIQIIDKKSDQALATGIDDGLHEKIINITLKKNNKKGLFGKNSLGFGTSGYYEAKSSNNLFNGEKKLSVIVAANNTGGNDNGAYSTTSGITENKQLKINYAGKLGDNFSFNTWAGYEYNANKTDQTLSRQNFYADSSTEYHEDSHNNNENKSLSGGVYFEYKPDSSTFLRLNESAGYYDNINSYSALFNSSAFNDYKINSGNNESSGSSKAAFLNGQVSYGRKLNNSGRNIFVNIYNSVNNNNGTAKRIFNNYFYPADTSSYALLVNQQQYNNSANTNLGTTLSYSEPIAENNTLNFSYAYNYGKNDAPKEVYDYNSLDNFYDLFNDSLSNHFNNYTNSNTASLIYNYSAKKTGFSVGVRWKNSLTQSHSVGKDSIYQQDYTGLLPNFNFYSAGKGKRLNIYYNAYIRAPQAYQLQPVVDNTNPLYIRLGNPSLKYAVVQTLRYNFNYYNAKKETGFNSNADFSSVSNNISNSITSDNETGSQVSQPLNMNGAYNWNAWVSYFRPVYLGDDKIKCNINMLASGSRMSNLLNGEENINRNNFLRIFFGLTYDTPEWIDLHTDFSVSMQSGNYSLQTNLNNTSYYFIISPTLTFKPVENTEINIDYDYRQAAGQSTGFNNAANIFNANVTQYFNNKKDVWLMLKAFDLFNQNINVSRINGDTFIQDSKTNSISRFLLLSLNFRLNKFSNAKENSSSSPGKNDL